MKKFAFIAVLVMVFALTALPALASVLDVGLNYGTATGLGSTDIRTGVMSVIRVLLGFLGIIAIILVLYGGFLWMTSAGNEEKVSQAKKIITGGIIGLIIIFVSYALASFVVTQIMSATGVV